MGRKLKCKNKAAPTTTTQNAKSMFEKKEEVYGYKTYFRELGYYLSRLEKYSKALEPFDQCLKKYPEDIRALMGRSIARAKEVQYEGALDDIKELIKIKPNDWTAFGHKALCTYLCCEFEDALVQNLRHEKFRKKPDTFTVGAMQCMDAIQNCIGERAGRPLRDYFKIIRKLAWIKYLEADDRMTTAQKKRKKKLQKKDEVWKKYETVNPVRVKCAGKVSETDDFDNENSILTKLYPDAKKSDLDIPPMQPFPYKPLQRHTTNIGNLLAQTYLDRLYLDKNFLRELPNMAGMKSPNYEGVKKINKLCKQGYKMLTYKQELLRARRPFYFIKFQQSLVPANLQKKLDLDRQERAKWCIQKAERLLEKLDDQVTEEQTVDACKTAEKLWTYCKNTPKMYLPDREEYLKTLYSLLGKSFLDLKRLNVTQYDWDKIKRIQFMLGIPIERVPSNDSVLLQYKDEKHDYKKQIKVLEEMVRNASCCEEVAWLYHELARYNIECKQMDLGRSYAKKCIREAEKVNNVDWAINAYMLLARIHVSHHHKYEAKNEVGAALGIAAHMRNYALIEYLNTTMEFIDKLCFDDLDILGGLEKRQKDIIGIMEGSGLKEEVSLLFRKMSAMPGTRRMSVLPGVKIEDLPTATAGARKQSIAPKKVAEEEADEPMPKSKNAGGTGGVKALLQFHID